MRVIKVSYITLKNLRTALQYFKKLGSDTIKKGIAAKMF